MEVRDPIHGSVRLYKGEIKVIDHPLFQRLRDIKQLGFTEMSFPGATHSRYSHSIGAMHLAGYAFDSALGRNRLLQEQVRRRFRDVVRLAACLHDIGHPPKSHCAEVALPSLERLRVSAYSDVYVAERVRAGKANATHEDMSVKIATESTLAGVIREQFPHVDPVHVAALLSDGVEPSDDFFIHDGLDFRVILSQLVSGELDVDRMDYLHRDSYFAGVGYGNFDSRWLISNLTCHVHEGKVHLAVVDRALYAVDDFLIARYHMFLMVYFHQRSVAYEEMLRRYFETEPGGYAIPDDVEKFAGVDDYHLQAHLRASHNPWARGIIARQAIRLLLEQHGHGAESRIALLGRTLDEAGIPHYPVLSRGVLSKYAHLGVTARNPIFVTSHDRYLPMEPRLLEQSTDLFDKYREQRSIGRIYVAREHLEAARNALQRRHGGWAERVHEGAAGSGWEQDEDEGNDASCGVCGLR